MFQRLCLLAVSLLLCEVALRFLGFEPRLSYPGHTLYRPDPVLGWTTVPGHHTLVFLDDVNFRKSFTVQIWPSGDRATRVEMAHAGERLILIGDSWIDGFGLVDEETIGWKLQEQHPDLNLVSAAAGGYSTLQALLRLKELFNTNPKRVRAVVYGMIDDHEFRNIGHPQFQRQLAARSSTSNFFLPYCELKETEQCVKIGPKWFYFELPFRRQSALVALIEDVIAEFQSRNRLGTEKKVTVALLRELDALTKAQGVTLLVAALQLTQDKFEFYRDLLEPWDIPFVDCRFPVQELAAFIIAGDGHPNPRGAKFIADCISGALSELATKVETEALTHSAK